ncbi:PAS and helix-turn-helix domain-containing protein [Aquicella lusitana]|uniref:PAS domain-containing protein n=1 Tax=Aquicella lusitana TaxID=254246 RepID=A0A370G2W6_9COXI|nr:PAS and helix-turn-helix domain-containing protein [Aquicella lusitana]RDI37580.1 PAS domain-containing protein [Aquicella lusitana]VVC73909.1 hypothetical protein AQULUS_16640 [Aquicella lusitana]
MPNRQKLDISHEMLIYRYGDGVRLLRPDKAVNLSRAALVPTGLTIGQAVRLPLSVTFLNTECAVQLINEQSATTSGFLSTKNAIGKSIRYVATPKSARLVMGHNREVMSTMRKKIYEENVLRKDEMTYHSLAIKTPILNEENKTIGLFGIGITLGVDPLAASLSYVAELGLLQAGEIKPAYPIRSEKKVCHIYLSSRENEILRHAVRGKSARMIAELLKISKRTVEQHLENIKTKMEVSSKAELIEKAIDYYM